MSSQVQELFDASESSKRKAVLDWISTSPYMSHHDRARESRLKDTGLWLLHHKDFLEWQNQSGMAVFWLRGLRKSGMILPTQYGSDACALAGSGKTKLSYDIPGPVQSADSESNFNIQFPCG
jgi:hypothetical protein